MLEIQQKLASAKIISVDTSKQSDDFKRRFAPRENYIKENFMPNLTKMGIDVSLFSAITPRDVELTDAHVKYQGQTFARGKSREGHLASPYQVVLALGHMNLWKQCVYSKKPLLIFEDDAYVFPENFGVIQNSISRFIELAETKLQNHILYLQSTCPWRPNKQKKTYSPSSLAEIDELLCELNPSWNDVSGTAAYMVVPDSAESMIDYCSSTPLWALDGMLDDAKKSGVVRICLPKDYTRNFSLHPIL